MNFILIWAYMREAMLVKTDDIDNATFDFHIMCTMAVLWEYPTDFAVPMGTKIGGADLRGLV